MKTKLFFPQIIFLTALFYSCRHDNNQNEFSAVKTELEKANWNFSKMNESLYNRFEKARLDNAVKVKKYYEQAMVAKKISDDLYRSIITLKENMPERGHITTDELTDLKSRIEKFRENISVLVDDRDREYIFNSTDTSDYKNYETALVKFQHNSDTTGMLMMLSLIQQKVKGIEYNVLSHLYMQIDETDLKFDTLAVLVVPENKFLHQGDDFTADIFLSAMSTTINPQIILGEVNPETNMITGKEDSTSVQVSAGIGHVKIKAQGEGKKKLSGLVKINAPDGSIKSYPFNTFYEVNEK